MVASRFEMAVERHQRKVFTFARYFLSDREEAEDVTQEVLLSLWKNRCLLGSDRLGAWLLRVTRNACYDRLRRRRIVAVASADADFDAVERVVADGADPEVLARSSEYRLRLLRALGGLRDPQRSVVILREIQGLSYREIADVLELPLATVRVALHRGRRRLRDELREVYYDAAAS